MESIQADVVIVGGGPGGYVAALRSAQHSMKTILIEKEKVGGMCLNWGCIPSKSLLASAEVFEKIKQAESFGIMGVDVSSIKPDWQKMMERAQSVVTRLTKGVQTLLDKNGVQTLIGEGVIQDKHTIQVENQVIECKHLILATGSEYGVPDFVEESEKSALYTPKTIYSIAELPQSMAIIGGGVIGVEFALLFAGLGVKVELIEQKEKIMPYMDDDLVSAMRLYLKKNKIGLHNGWKAVGFTSKGIDIQKGDQNKQVTADIYVSALSRKPNLKGLDALIHAGIEQHNQGFIRTDLRARTSIPHVYAVGDLNGRFMLAHVASAEAIAAVETIAGEGRDLVYDMMPYNLYGKLEFASVGLTEKAAEKRGFLAASGKFPLTANGKALAQGQAEGFIKVVYEKQYGEILGVHIAAANATDLIGESVMAMQVESTVWDVASAVHPHPTLSEAFLEATFKGMDKPLHML